MFGLGWLELVIVFAVAGFMIWWRWPPSSGGRGPMIFGFGTVPVHDPPPTRDPDAETKTR